MPRPTRAPRARRKLFAVGGPLFNALLVVAFFGVIAFVVGSPTRADLQSSVGAEADAETIDVEAAGGPVAEAADPDASGPDAAANSASPAGRRPAAAFKGLAGAGATTTTTAAPAARSGSGAGVTNERTSPAGAGSGSGSGSPLGRGESPGGIAPGIGAGSAAAGPAVASSGPAPTPGGPAAPTCATADELVSNDCPPPSTTDPPEVPAPGTVTPGFEDVVAPALRYYGLHTREAPGWMAEVDEVSSLVGKAPNLLLFFTDFGRPFPAASVAASWERGMVPIVSLEPIVPGSTTGQPSLADLWGGQWDEYLDAWAAAARDQGRPIVLRFAHEMNGDWYSWSEGVNGNSSGDYARAWRYLHERFEAQGAHNVVWLWSVNRVDAVRTPLAPLYPGDDVVDWVGTSGFLREVPEDGEPSFAATFATTLAELRAVAPGKRVLLSEVAAGTEEASRVTWTRSLFAGLAANPDLLGFVWFNDVKSGGDWRLQGSDALVDVFARGVADPGYGSGSALPASSA